MLILTRRLGENIVVGDDIVISVMEIRGDAVRLGIQAPRSITVHREEVYLELQRVNRQAARSAGAADADIAAAVKHLQAAHLRQSGQGGRPGVGGHDVAPRPGGSDGLADPGDGPAPRPSPIPPKPGSRR